MSRHRLSLLLERKQRYAVGGCQHSDMATFSFHPVKGFTTGEGGAVLTNDEAFFQKVSMLRSHGMCRDPDFSKMKT